MAFPIIINWVSPISFLGMLEWFLFLSHFSMRFLCAANRIARDGTPRSAAPHLGLYCLHMSHKRDARIIYVKYIIFSNFSIFTAEKSVYTA